MREVPGVVFPRDGLLATFMGEDNCNRIDGLVRRTGVCTDSRTAGTGRRDLVGPLMFDTATHGGEPRVACQSNSKVF